jgi:hypothetical protein
MGATELLLTVSLRGAVFGALKTWLARNRQTTISIRSGDQTIELSGTQSPEEIQTILNGLTFSGENVNDKESSGSKFRPRLTVGLPGGGGPAVEDINTIPVEAGGLALSMSTEVITTARRRISLVFKLNVALALTLAFILFGGVATCIGSAVFGHELWASVFGGVAVGDLLGIYLFKPIATISAAVVASQRLELVHMRLVDQLNECAKEQNADKRVACQTAVWDSIQRDLAAMADNAG